jgi:hypothetical protein
MDSGLIGLAALVLTLVGVAIFFTGVGCGCLLAVFGVIAVIAAVALI